MDEMDDAELEAMTASALVGDEVDELLGGPDEGANADGVVESRERELQRMAPPTMLRAGEQTHASMISSVREQLQASVVSRAEEDLSGSSDDRNSGQGLTIDGANIEDSDLLRGAILQTPHLANPQPDTPLTRLMPALETDSALLSPTIIRPLEPTPAEPPAAKPDEAPAAGTMNPPPSRKRPRPAHFTFDSVA